MHDEGAGDKVITTGSYLFEGGLMSAPVLLLDGASMWFRSFFGVPSSITAPDGRPVNAVRGFIDSIATLITRERPGRLVVCLDLDWRPQFRVDLIPSYKAHRVAVESPNLEFDGGEPDLEEVPDELTPQVDMIMELLDAFGIATAGAAGYEADDVLGTLAAAERHDPVVVVSGDRDLLQLVDDDPPPVRVLYLGRGLSNADHVRPGRGGGEVPAFRRIGPGRRTPNWPCCAAIRPTGCPACRASARRAQRRCLRSTGRWRTSRGRARSEIKLAKAFRAKLLAATDYIEAAGPVVQVAHDAPVRFSTDDDRLPLTAADPAGGRLASAYGVGSSIGRLQKALDGLPGWVAPFVATRVVTR